VKSSKNRDSEQQKKQESQIAQFLTQSVKLLDANYASPADTKTGIYAAFLDSQTKAKERQKINLEDLVGWHAMIANELKIPVETLSPASTQKTRYILARFLDHLGQMTQLINPFLLVDTMAYLLHDFEQAAVFGAENGIVCRLLINYAATWCNIPIILFSTKEKEMYLAGVEDLKSARLYLSQKIREYVFDHRGNLLKRVSKGDLADDYEDEQGHHLRVEWHALHK
jgi:hypothetical protein